MSKPRVTDESQRKGARHEARDTRAGSSSRLSFGLLTCCWLFASCQPRGPATPVIPTTDLDPAVAALIETTLAETRTAPASGAAWGRLGSVLMHYEFVEEASAAFEQAARLSPAEPRWPYLHALLLQHRDPAAALAGLRRAVALAERREETPALAPHASRLVPMLRLAQFLAERGHDDEARSLFDSLLRSDPNHFPARLGLVRLQWNAAARMKNGGPGGLNSKFEIRNSDFEKCLADSHTAKAAHLLLATVRQASGDAAAAADASRKAAALPADTPWPDPWWAETLSFRVGKKARMEDASSLIERNRLLEAAEILAGVTRDYPRDEDAWYQSGWVLNQAGQFAVAERTLREHLRLAPQSPKGHAQLAVALLAQKRYQEAVPVLEAAVKLKPNWRELHSNLGFACVQLGRDSEATGHFRNALLHDPNYLPSHTALAELLIRRGGREEARSLLRRALEINPGDPKARAMWQRTE